jgi:hypothetical protein
VGRALHREIAQAQVDAAATQTLAEAGARAELVDRDDHRAGAVQHRALHRGRVKHVVCLAGAMRLDDLGTARADRVTERFEQTAGVAPDAALIGGRPAVEGNPQEGLLDSIRLFTGLPENALEAR